MKLFPEESLVFVRIANAHDLGERLRETSTGRMFHDPQLRPFIENLYGKAGELYAEQAQGKLGISWDDMKKLPKGEVAFAVVARPDKRPALLLMVDQGEEASVADKLVDKALEIAQEKGGEFSKEKIGDVEVTVVRDHDRENRMFGVCQRENTIIVATDPNVIRGVLWHWDHAGESTEAATAAAPAPESVAEKTAKDAASDKASTTGDDSKSDKHEAEFVPGRTLAENDRFATIVKSCRRPQDPPPQLVFFVDPIELVRNVGRGNGGLSFVLGLFPSLGVDGLMAIGGTSTYSTDEYDNLAQLHVLLENPRSGVMLLPAFLPGETTPQPFVPLALQSYLAWNWNLRTTYDRLVALVDQYRYKGSVDKFVKENISDKLGIDVLTQVVDNLKGRYTWMIGFEQPVHFQGDQHVLAAELNDENAAKDALKSVIEKFPDLFEERHFGTATYYAIKVPSRKEVAEEDKPFHPFVGIMDGYLFIGTSCQRFEQCVAARDGTAERLVDSNDFARASAVIGRETRGTTPVMFTVSRFEETLRQWYGLLTSDKTRSLLDEKKEKNPFLKALADAMEENKLPPFDVLMQYTSPGGGILYDTDSGYHMISFMLRNEPAPGAQTPVESK
ncbi:MAG TPA: hypothetical protein VHU84_10330 [Lacipirellulaceae bacterium]|nr:hypothetical protein [Lacipirellulaceae bacterium]